MRTKTCWVIPNSTWAIWKRAAMYTSSLLAFRNLKTLIMIKEVEMGLKLTKKIETLQRQVFF